MAIRIRKVDGVTVALCAAETDEKPGDTYLDDNAHHALSTKFGLDWQEMGFISNPPIDKVVQEAMLKEKVRDANAVMEAWQKEEAERQKAVRALNGYDKAFFKWFERHGWQIRSGTTIEVWSHNDARCALTPTREMIERLVKAGKLRRVYCANAGNDEVYTDHK